MPKAIRTLRVSMLAITTALAFTSTAHAAPAQTDEDQGLFSDIIVTARKREERLQDTPVAVTAF